MKGKFLCTVLISVVLGAICGKVVFNHYQENEMVFQEKSKVYFLQQGVYSQKDTMDENVAKLNASTSVFEDGKYHVYVGITKSVKNVDKIVAMYKDLGMSLYMKEVNISDNEFINNLEQYDILLKSAQTKEEIMAVNKVILASYDEIVLNH